MLGELEKQIFHRSSLLLGRDVMERMQDARVILFGVGGVGSWCAEGLIRSGIGHLTIVDADTVNITNVNRQLEATTKTVGQVKVDVLRERLLEINPNADIKAVNSVFSEETCESFDLSSYDYIIDAIDSLKDKISLILHACATDATFFSAMGAALKVDPTKIRVAEFWEVRGCPLGAIIRKRMRHANTLPSKKFICVYDEEVLPNRGEADAFDEGKGIFQKAQTNGSTAPVTAIFGMTLSGLVVQDIYNKTVR